METQLEQIAVKAANHCRRAWCGKSARHVLWEPGAGDRLRRPGGCGNGAMVEPLRHRQTKGAATAMFYLTLPRHISTLPNIAIFQANPSSAPAQRCVPSTKSLRRDQIAAGCEFHTDDVALRAAA